MKKKVKVRLLTDLTSYEPNFILGAEGIAYTDKVEFTDWEEELVKVVINGCSIFVGWRSLEILDEDYWKDREKDVKQAYKIDLAVGPRGGFKYMRIYSLNRNKVSRIYTTNVKHESQRLLEMAHKYNKSVNNLTIRVSKLA